MAVVVTSNIRSFNILGQKDHFLYNNQFIITNPKSIYFIGYTLEFSLTVQTINVNYQNSRNKDYTVPQEKFYELNVDSHNWTYARI